MKVKVTQVEVAMGTACRLRKKKKDETKN